MGRIAKRLALALVLFLLAAEATLQLAALLSPVLVSRASEPSPGVEVTILCVGDSHTFGAPLPERDSYPSQLRRALRKRFGDGVEVVNLGVPGANSPMIANRLAGQIAHYDPDLVIVWGGVNSLWNPTETEVWSEDEEGWSWRALAFRSKLVRLLAVTLYRWTTPTHTRAKLTEWTEERTVFRFGNEELVVSEQQPPASWPEKRKGIERDFTAMIEVAESFDIPIMIVTYPYDSEPAIRMVNDAARTVAFIHGVDVVETRASLERAMKDGYRAEDLIVDAAGPHPKEPLYRYVVQNMLPVINRLLWPPDDCDDRPDDPDAPPAP